MMVGFWSPYPFSFLGCIFFKVRFFGGGVGVWGSGDELVTRRPRGPCPWNSTKEKHYGKMILFSNNDNVAGMASEDVYIF